MRTLFLQAPSFDGFDGGAGSRYQARREIKSFWFPTWLAQPAALVEGSRVLDAPADGLGVERSLEIACRYELVVIHTSTPSFPSDAKFAQLLKADNPEAVMKRLIQERYPVYALADITVESRDVPHEVMVDAVIEALNTYFDKEQTP